MLTGRTLYVPAPFPPLLSRGQVAAIIAHELAHFVGEDTVYSQHFLPLYAGMSRSMDAVAARGSGSTWIDAVFQPAAVLAWHVLDTVSRAVDDMYQRPGHADADLVATVVARAGASGFTEPARHLEDRQPHPTDSRPPTRQRIEAFGLPIDDALLELPSRSMRAEDAAFTASLFADWPGLRGAIGGDLLDVAKSRDQRLQAELEHAAGAVVADVPVHERAPWCLARLAA